MSKPEARQWWCANDGSGPVFIVGCTAEGKIVFQSRAQGQLLVDYDGWSNWHHEPRCTGWDWVVPSEPQEDPEEWVVQDRVPVRIGIDTICWDDRLRLPTENYFVNTFRGAKSEGKCHGYRTGGIFLSVRCRRKDLPPLGESWSEMKQAMQDELVQQVTQQPAKKRVRLWISDHDGRIYHADEADLPDDIELHHDGECFYVEEQA